jgi:hypothetical protein
MEQFLDRLQHQDTPESRRRGLVAWEPQEGDVIVATPPKAGTTLVLQMAHCLRSRGDVSFEEINKDCVPCLEMAYDAGVPLDLDQRYVPRLFKTHAWFPHVPGIDNSGVRVVCVIRDPFAIAVSFYHFLGSGWFFSKDDIDIDTFIQGFVVTGRGEPTDYTSNAGIFHIIRSYYEHRNDDRVLLMCYENIVKHKRVHARKLAEFLNVPCDDELLDQVGLLSRYAWRRSAPRMRRPGRAHVRFTLARSFVRRSKEWMSAHATKFDEHFMKLAINEKAGLPKDAGLRPGSTGKVRVGKDGDDCISVETRAMLQAAWEEVLQPVTGCRSYDELLAKLDEELYSGWYDVP